MSIPIDQLLEHEQTFIKAMQKQENEDFLGIDWQRTYGGHLHVSAWWSWVDVQAHVLVVDRIDKPKYLDHLHWLITAVAAQWHLTRWYNDTPSVLDIADLSMGYDGIGLAVPENNLGEGVAAAYAAMDDVWHLSLCPIPIAPNTINRHPLSLTELIHHESFTYNGS